MRALLLALALLALPAYAEEFDDQPQPQESFSHFFRRITRGGTFPGIELTAPAAFQEKFLPRIWRPTWQGRLDRVQKQLKAKGVDVWLDWYATNKPLPLLGADLSTAYSAAAAELGRCHSCRAWPALMQSDWPQTTTEEREALAWAHATKANLFAGRTLLDFLADQHGLTAADARPRVEFKLLHSADFKAAVKKLGWNGDIYFRGITAPSPENPQVFWILLNDDLMRQMTPFRQPLLQALEYSGILTHELSHVMQNIAAERLGLELNISSPEGALLVEGEAEYLAERALDQASAAQAAPNPLALFSAEAASEIVNRPGQSSQGNLFPYTVGMPFAAALFDFQDEPALRAGILQVIAGRLTLAELLAGKYLPR